MSELHACVSLSSPLQLSVTKAGCGLTHVRVRVCIPPSQVLVHSPQAAHSDQRASPEM